MMFSGLAGARLDWPSQNTTILSYYVTNEDLSMIVGAQMRAARAALNWSIENLADKSGVSARTIMRLEGRVDGAPARPDPKHSSTSRLPWKPRYALYLPVQLTDWTWGYNSCASSG